MPLATVTCSGKNKVTIKFDINQHDTDHLISHTIYTSPREAGRFNYEFILYN